MNPGVEQSPAPSSAWASRSRGGCIFKLGRDTLQLPVASSGNTAPQMLFEFEKYSAKTAAKQMSQQRLEDRHHISVHHRAPLSRDPRVSAHSRGRNRRGGISNAQRPGGPWLYAGLRLLRRLVGRCLALNFAHGSGSQIYSRMLCKFGFLG